MALIIIGVRTLFMAISQDCLYTSTWLNSAHGARQGNHFSLIALNIQPLWVFDPAYTHVGQLSCTRDSAMIQRQQAHIHRIVLCKDS